MNARHSLQYKIKEMNEMRKRSATLQNDGYANYLNICVTINVKLQCNSLQHKIDEDCNKHIGSELILYQTPLHRREIHTCTYAVCQNHLTIHQPSIGTSSIHMQTQQPLGSGLRCQIPALPNTIPFMNTRSSQARHPLRMGPDCCGVHKV